MKRHLLLLSAIIIGITASAQAPAMYELRSVPALENHGLKYLHGVIHEFDAEGRATVFQDRIKILLNDAVRIEEVIAQLHSATGATFILVNAQPTAERAVEPVIPAGFPVAPAPGDPLQEAEHAAAKQAWRAANPELHRTYIDQLRSRTPSHE